MHTTRPRKAGRCPRCPRIERGRRSSGGRGSRAAEAGARNGAAAATAHGGRQLRMRRGASGGSRRGRGGQAEAPRAAPPQLAPRRPIVQTWHCGGLCAGERLAACWVLRCLAAAMLLCLGLLSRLCCKCSLPQVQPGASQHVGTRIVSTTARPCLPGAPLQLQGLLGRCLGGGFVGDWGNYCAAQAAHVALTYQGGGFTPALQASPPPLFLTRRLAQWVQAERPPLPGRLQARAGCSCTPNPRHVHGMSSAQGWPRLLSVLCVSIWNMQAWMGRLGW